MARLKLSASGLRSPLDLSTTPEPELPPRLVPPTEVDDVAFAAALQADPAPAPRAAVPSPTPAPVGEAHAAPAPEDTPASTARDADATPSVKAPTPSPSSTEAPASSTEAPAPSPQAPTLTGTGAVDTSDLPAWALGLDTVALAPARLLGRPKQTALILDRDLSGRADALVAATGPRVTFAAIVTAILHFHLPADGEAAARTIGGYRRRKLEALDHPWEERNARLPEPLRAELDDVVAGATGRVASVHRSTLVNALLDAHLPATPDDASRLVTRMEMVRGGAFLDHVG